MKPIMRNTAARPNLSKGEFVLVLTFKNYYSTLHSEDNNYKYEVVEIYS